MPRRPKEILAGEAQQHVADLKTLLDGFLAKLNRNDLREKVVALIPAFYALRDLGSGLIPRSLATAASTRIIAYLKQYSRTLIHGDELMVVSGIQEYARRIRELRVEDGWVIYSGRAIRELAEDSPEAAEELASSLSAGLSGVLTDHYILMSLEQDREAAHRWHQINGIRRKRLPIRASLLEFLRMNVGKPVTIDELRYVANDKSEWARRVRELRTEDGWPVFGRTQGRPDLPSGCYVFEEDKQLAPHDRRIPDGVRVKVLERDHFQCVHCGWSQDKLTKADPRKALELHHIIEHAAGGANTVENLLTLCNVDHDRVHAGTLARVGETFVERAKPRR